MDNYSNHNVYIIAELCCNHQGNIKIAKKMIDSLACFPTEYKIHAIKFQKRYPKIILSKEQYNAPHPNPKQAFANTYGLHREYLEFNIEQHKKLKLYCEQKDFVYSSSVFDIVSAKEILSLNPKMIKISSANNTDLNLLRYIDENYNGEIHISLGMTTPKETEKIINTININRKNIILYACTSAYPTPDNKICLLEISKLKKIYSNDIKAIGFSGHHIGIIHDIAAIALGATYIERHLTLNRRMKGTDQKISLLPSEFLELSKNIHRIIPALAYKKQDILDVEEEIRKRLKQI